MNQWMFDDSEVSRIQGSFVFQTLRMQLVLENQNVINIFLVNMVRACNYVPTLYRPSFSFCSFHRANNSHSPHSWLIRRLLPWWYQRCWCPPHPSPYNSRNNRRMPLGTSFSFRIGSQIQNPLTSTAALRSFFSAPALAQSIVGLHGGHTHPPYRKCQDKH